MTTPLLYRRRFIPNELIPLKDDIILAMEKDLIITKWVTLHPRKDIARGISAYYLDQGFKISKVYDRNNKIVYWYCDIIQSKINSEKNTVIIEDLLIDVILYENGMFKVMDLDELCDALDQGMITQTEATKALRTLDNLLKIIYEGQFYNFQSKINQAEENTMSQ
jgi:predicted RNA-binding protein associated with RNAse of E/G family